MEPNSILSYSIGPILVALIVTLVAMERCTTLQHRRETMTMSTGCFSALKKREALWRRIGMSSLGTSILICLIGMALLIVLSLTSG